jgi:hypothetical protein
MHSWCILGHPLVIFVRIALVTAVSHAFQEGNQSQGVVLRGPRHGSYWHKVQVATSAHGSSTADFTCGASAGVEGSRYLLTVLTVCI